MPKVQEHRIEQLGRSKYSAGPPGSASTASSSFDAKQKRLKSRQKQINLGKNTIGYSRYRKLVPKKSRVRGEKKHPWTPNKYKDCSKRAFDGIVRAWRRALHEWDPQPETPSSVISDERSHGKEHEAGPTVSGDTARESVQVEAEENFDFDNDDLL